MEITEIDRAQVIINVLRERIRELEDELDSERVAHQLSVLSYQRSVQMSNSSDEEVNGLDG